MNNAAEFTFSLIGFTYGRRTNIAKRVLNNKDAALLILAANGGVMRVGDVKAVMVDPSGPGGGHPVYEFTGTRAQLEAFVIDFYEAGSANSEDVEFYFEDAEEIG